MIYYISLPLSLFSFIIFSPNIFSKELIVYSSRKEHLIKDIFKQYTNETGILIKYKTGKSASLIQVLKAEGEGSPADIFMTVDAGNLWFAGNENLLEEISSSVLEKNIPKHLRDSDGKWFGLSIRARTIVYNTNKVKVNDLSTYENLADKSWKNRLCLRTSKKVYNQSLVAMLIYEKGKKNTEKIIKGWVNNAVEIFSSDTAVLKAIASGQCDVGIVNSYYYGRLMRKSPDLSLKIFWPNQKDSYGVHINISGVGVLKSSKRKKEAIRFIEWLSSKSAQKSFAQINLEYPINKLTEQAVETIEWGSFKSNTHFNLTDAGKLQKDAVKLMQNAKYK